MLVRTITILETFYSRENGIEWSTFRCLKPSRLVGPENRTLKLTPFYLNNKQKRITLFTQLHFIGEILFISSTLTGCISTRTTAICLCLLWRRRMRIPLGTSISCSLCELWCLTVCVECSVCMISICSTWSGHTVFSLLVLLLYLIHLFYFLSILEQKKILINYTENIYKLTEIVFVCKLYMVQKNPCCKESIAFLSVLYF